MRGIHIFEKPCYREICAMRGRDMRRPPVIHISEFTIILTCEYIGEQWKIACQKHILSSSYQFANQEKVVNSAELFGLYQPTSDRNIEYEKETSISSITKNIWKYSTFKLSSSKMDKSIHSHLVFSSIVINSVVRNY